MRLPRGAQKPGQITDKEPPIVIPDVPAGTALATDQPTGLTALVGQGVGAIAGAIAWLTEVLQVVSGNRDELRGASPAAGNGA
jgi:hypothetical protein